MSYVGTARGAIVLGGKCPGGNCPGGNCPALQQKISTGVPQGSILDSLFFNVFINDLFLFIETTTLCNYAGDNTMYSSDKNCNIVTSRLRHDFAIISEWFYWYSMVLSGTQSR